MFSNFVYNAVLHKVSAIIINEIILVFRYFIKKNDKPKVLVIVLHKIGDTVFTLHAIKKIQYIYGENISIICSNNTKVIIEKCCPNAEIFGVASKDDFFFDRIAKPKVRKLVKGINPGIIIDITGNIKSATSIFTAKAKIVSGFNERRHFTSLYTHYVEKRSIPTLIDLYLDPVKALHNFTVTDVEKEFPVKLNPTGYILIHPFAGWEAKEWDFDKFLKLAQKLNVKYNSKIVGRVQDFTEEQLNEIHKYNIEVTFSPTLEDLMAEIEKCSLFISNDSGPLYLANMLGRPTFTIYGPTNPLYSLPYGKFNMYIQNNVNCSPKINAQLCATDAGRDGCPYFRCMRELEVKPVYDSIIQFIIKGQIVSDYGRN